MLGYRGSMIRIGNDERAERFTEVDGNNVVSERDSV